jgi:hypothetical protein
VQAEGRATALAEGLVWLDRDSDPWQDLGGGCAVELRILHGHRTAGEPLSLLSVRFIGRQRSLFGDGALVRYIGGTLIVERTPK